ncbi:MAG: hypothetical protein WC373_16460 [Smithella sp.]|jgi:uncharacterized membrane protein
MTDIKDRRNDVGLKMVYVILTAIITFLMSTVFFETYRKAEAALALSNDNKKDIAVIQNCVSSVDSKLEKMDLKLDKLIGWNK